MKILKLIIISLTIALFAFACSQNNPANSTTANANKPAANSNMPATNSQPSASPDELASAKKIYSEKCVKCHKENGEGGVTDIEGTKIKAPNFTIDKMKKEPDSEYIEAIEKGITDEGMPAFKGKISDEEIKNLVKLIRRDFQKQ